MTIITLDVNTCEKCRALQGQVFLIDDAPVIPIHPHCHCSYCVPADGDRAEVTASGANLDELYAREGVKGYEQGSAAKLYTPAGMKPQAKAAEGMAAFERPEIELTRVPKSARAKAELMPQAPADSAGISSVPAIAQPETEAAKTAENTGLSGVSGLREMANSGIMELPKLLKQETNEILTTSVEVDTEAVHGVVPEGTEIEDVVIIAGAGTRSEIRDIARLNAQYSKGNWQKKAGIVQGNSFKYELHWYALGTVVPWKEIKLKGVKKK